MKFNHHPDYHDDYQKQQQSNDIQHRLLIHDNCIHINKTPTPQVNQINSIKIKLTGQLKAN